MSEHATWSSRYYGRIIAAALAAVGAPPDLVQIVTGYADAGEALVTGGVDKLIFVGSTEVRPWPFSHRVLPCFAGRLSPSSAARRCGRGPSRLGFSFPSGWPSLQRVSTYMACMAGKGQ